MLYIKNVALQVTDVDMFNITTSNSESVLQSFTLQNISLASICCFDSAG